MLGEHRVAGFRRRLGAGLIDWSIAFVAVWFGVIVSALLGGDRDDLWFALSYTAILLLPLLYFGLSWARTGQTVGLRANDLEVVSTSTGERPGLPRALLRAVVAVLTFIALWLPLVGAFGDASDSRATAIVVGSLALMLLALAGHLWALVDRRGQSLQDRLFGLAVLAERPSRS